MTRFPGGILVVLLCAFLLGLFGEALGASPRQVFWREGETEHRAFLSETEVAVFRGGGMAGAQEAARAVPGSVVTAGNAFVTFLRSAQSVSGADLAAAHAQAALAGGAAAPVCYATLREDPADRLVPTGEIICRLAPGVPPETIQGLARGAVCAVLREIPAISGAYVLSAESPLASFAASRRLAASPNVLYAAPNLLRTRKPRATPDDPLFPSQWHLQNTGQGGGLAGADARLPAAWDLTKGSAARVVAIVDDGLEIAHPDLSPNLISGLSHDYVDGDSDPTGGGHGTACAGVAAARGWNATGVTGAAPLGGLLGFRLLGAETDANEADALTRSPDVAAIYSNSWGPTDDGLRLEGPGPITRDAFLSGVATGRGGLGSIYVWAGGNGGDNDNANYDGYANNRCVIAVGASTNLGARSAYSERGANLLVNAPSNGGPLGITTTDRLGVFGYTTGDYMSTFGGTSSAAPLVAGIVALMLDVNPNLGWRDVREILARTAVKNSPDDAGWTQNGAGFHVNHSFGFGRVDAAAAVALARSWVDLPPEAPPAIVSASPNLPVPDNNAAGVAQTLPVAENLRVESVEVIFTAADHPSWGDLEIVLVSPSGTESVLAQTHSGGTTARYDHWRFGSARHLGEPSRGPWTLRVRDMVAGNAGTFQSFSLIVHGTRRGGAAPATGLLLGGE